MKRFVIAIVLLVCIGAGSFYVNHYADNAIKETKDAFFFCAKKEKNVSLDVIKVKTALNIWEKNKKILYMLMFHDDFAELEKNIVELRYLSEFPESGEIERISSETYMMLDDLRDNFRVNFENIL